MLKKFHVPHFRLTRKDLCIPYGLFMILFVVFPLLLIFYYAFTSRETGQFTFENFTTVFTQGSNFQVIGMSLLVGGLNTIFCLIIAYPLAYLLANSKYNKNTILVYLFIMPMWINFVIRTIATKDILSWMGITSANMPLLATIIGMVYNYLPFAILPLYTTMLKLDKSQIEAASDLGASPFYVFVKTILPMSSPGIVSAILMTFMPTMSSYVIADKLGGGKTTLIGNLIALQFGSASNYNVGSVLALIMLVMIGVSLLVTKNSKKEEKVRGGLW